MKVGSGSSPSKIACLVLSGICESDVGKGVDTLLSFVVLSSHGFPPIPPRGAFGGPPTLGRVRGGSCLL